MASVEIFCCYARKDQSLLNELRIHLIPLKRQGLITIWADTDIDAGIEWEKEVEKHLDTAQMILLLISPEFMASDYCYSVEMKRAMERHERGEARVIPIILRHTSWQLAPFGKLQPLPTGAKPVISSSWRNKNVAFHDVAEGIRKTIESLITKLALSTETISTVTTTNIGKVSTSSVPVQIPLFTPSIKNKRQASSYVSQLAKHYTEILDAYEQALQLDPTDAYTYTLKGDTLYDLERYEEALVAYERSIQLDPENPYTYIFQGHALDELERYEEALAAYEQAIRLDPKYATAYKGKGDALYELKRYKEALVAYNRYIQLNPNDPQAYIGKANTKKQILKEKHRKLAKKLHNSP
jgi:tetratricopeptide (TPR) repeat protein